MQLNTRGGGVFLTNQMLILQGDLSDLLSVQPWKHFLPAWAEGGRWASGGLSPEIRDPKDGLIMLVKIYM